MVDTMNKLSRTRRPGARASVMAGVACAPLAATPRRLRLNIHGRELAVSQRLERDLATVDLHVTRSLLAQVAQVGLLDG